MTKPLLLAFAAGCIVMLCAWVAISDWRAMAAGWEEERCKDKSPEFKAMMVRAPGEAHSTEWCGQIIRFGSPSWVPELGHPLRPGKRQPDAAWLLEALEQYANRPEPLKPK